MTQNKSLTVIGLMSGTTFDGVDAAVIKTDGEKINDLGPTITITYPEDFRNKIRNITTGSIDLKNILELEDEITLLHCHAVQELLKTNKISKEDIDLVAFHGQTIYHDSKNCKTWQLANGSLMVRELGINVITDFRRRDLAHGGEGAPLVPFFHKAISESMPKPIAFVNIGGVSNITYVNKDGEMVAFDSGPGCALIDDWVYTRVKTPFDYNGEIAARGKSNKHKIDYFIESTPFFNQVPPKSLDRNEFSNIFRKLSSLNTADGAATLTELSARAIHEGKKFLPSQPEQWVVCGGGRKNKYLMNLLRDKYQLNVVNIDDLKFNNFKLDGDFIEAQAFAYLGARSFKNLPYTLPSTTGAIQPASGGAFYQA
ncbi:MAG: anhydro-N-acetylmuramic acid kinase [Rickettsiales bacterium]